MDSRFYNETMPSESPVRVLILTANAQLRERAAGALLAGGFSVLTDAVSDSPDRCQVLVTDRVIDPRLLQELAGQGPPGIVGIGITEHVDVSLPADFTSRELCLAAHLVAKIAELREQRDQFAEAHSAVRELAETDPLTGLPNRRAWERHVPAMLARAHRGGEPAWLALLDLDGFKRINDQFGMARGDQTLAQCGQALSAALRRGDLVARLGGDEFGILLVGVDENRVLEVFERLRTSVAAGGDVTASIGVVAAMSGKNETEILQTAEVAMRAGKRAGGDRVNSAT